MSKPTQFLTEFPRCFIFRKENWCENSVGVGRCGRSYNIVMRAR